MASPKLHAKSLEYEAFEYLQHWKPANKILPPQSLMQPSSKYYPLFLHLYTKTKSLYKKLPPRKNGENAFVHPINVVQSLLRARITDEITICAGIMHDYAEEMVDIYKKNHKIKGSKEEAKQLDAYENTIFKELEEELGKACTEHSLSPDTAEALIKTLKLLTRHKRHFYYQYITGIFNEEDEEIKERALQIKLADRMHNVLCIECFNEEERTYQCFKNLFILNNTKKYLLDKYGKDIFTHKRFSPTARLFNKCARSTYDGFMTICSLTKRKGIKDIITILQLAFKKYALEIGGLWVVTKLDEEQVHPFRLFQGVVRKYDARLHHEWDRYFGMKEKEMKYCRNFFFDFHFTEEQLQAILDYKDAYSLKEVIAYLLYQPDFYIAKFVYAELSTKGRIKERIGTGDS